VGASDSTRNSIRTLGLDDFGGAINVIHRRASGCPLHR
jgi:hypothetical protein